MPRGVCPRCGQPGWLEVQKRGKNRKEYYYFYHYEPVDYGGVTNPYAVKLTACYLGPKEKYDYVSWAQPHELKPYHEQHKEVEYLLALAHRIKDFARSFDAEELIEDLTSPADKIDAEEAEEEIEKARRILGNIPLIITYLEEARKLLTEKLSRLEELRRQARAQQNRPLNKIVKAGAGSQ